MNSKSMMNAILGVVVLAIIGGVLITQVVDNEAFINTTAVPALAPVPPLLDTVIVIAVIISAVLILTKIGGKGDK